MVFAGWDPNDTHLARKFTGWDLCNTARAYITYHIKKEKSLECKRENVHQHFEYVRRRQVYTALTAVRQVRGGAARCTSSGLLGGLIVPFGASKQQQQC